MDAGHERSAGQADLLIKGITRSGQTFRPSDWADRLCGVMSAFGPDEQLRYSPLVAPAMRGGVRCVLVRGELAELEPRLFRFFLGFALDNELQVTMDADAVASVLPEALARLSSEGAAPPAAPRVSEDY
jgi:hypothetical protein